MVQLHEECLENEKNKVSVSALRYLCDVNSIHTCASAVCVILNKVTKRLKLLLEFTLGVENQFML